MLKFLSRHWFLASLAVCLVIGFGPSHWLRPVAASNELRGGIVAVVMFLMAVTLKADAVVQSIRSPGPSLLAIGLNIFLVPAIAAAVAWVLPRDLRDGLIVAALVPCTLASASVWTRRAGGDEGISMMTTVVTNLVCFVVTPAGLALLLSRSGQIDYLAQVQKLFLLVGLPILVAQVFRRLGGSIWADQRKQRLSFLALLGILAMVTLGAVETSRRIETGNAALGGPGWLLAMVGLAVLVHIAALLAGIGLAQSFRLKPPQQIAVGIGGSQKTLMVGLEIAIGFGASMLPMIAYHISQLVVDTVVVDRWKQATTARQNARQPSVQSPTDTLR